MFTITKQRPIPARPGDGTPGEQRGRRSTEETSQGQAPVAPNPLHEAIAENVRADSRSKNSSQPNLNWSARTSSRENPNPHPRRPGRDGCPAQVRRHPPPGVAERPGTRPTHSATSPTPMPRRTRASSRGIAGALVAETVRLESAAPPATDARRCVPGRTLSPVARTVYAALAAIPAATQYADVRLLVASTKRRYPYSERSIDEKYAQSLMEWEEVGRFQNP